MLVTTKKRTLARVNAHKKKKSLAKEYEDIW
jgi:hypothetical protein